MRFALAQLNFTVGAFDRNFEQIADAATRARRAGADLLVLSELATTGYPPRDLLNHRRFVDANLALRDRIAALSDRDLGILVGCAEPNDAAEGKPLFNTAVLCHEGRIVARHRKTLLPTYDVFDEDQLEAVARYVFENPARAKLIDDARNWNASGGAYWESYRRRPS